MIDMDVIHIFAIKDNRIVDLNRKVEEMQKTLEWYADERVYRGSFSPSGNGIQEPPIVFDGGERARQALKGDPK